MSQQGDEAAAQAVPRGAAMRAELRHYAPFIYRIGFTYLLYLYLHGQGVNPGLLNLEQIVALQCLYLSATFALMVRARRRGLGVGLQRVLIVMDFMALIVGVPHDPNRGLPTLLVFYLVYADLGLRYQYRLYLEALAMGLVSVVLMLYIRAAHTQLGLTAPDIWQVFLLCIVVVHGLQLFGGRYRARQRLEDSQARLQLAIDTPGIGVWSSNDPLRELQIDGHIRAVLGLEPMAMDAPRPMADFMSCIHPEDVERVSRQYAEFLRSRATDYEDQYRVVRPDGTVRIISSRAKAMRRADGHAERVSGMVWDLTEQVRQQQALQRLEERYRLATAAARVAVWIWHYRENRFEHDPIVNPIMGLPRGSEVASLQDVIGAVHPDDQPDFAARVQALIEGNARDFFDEVRLQPRNGEVRVMQIRATVERDEAGRPLRIAGANWDATELARARQELERTVRELDDFTYIASHDLKEPLRGIASYADFLNQDFGELLDDNGRQMLSRIRQQARRMTALINDLLEFARVGRGGLTLEAVDLRALLAELTESLEFSLRERGARVRLHQPVPRIQADRVQLGELLRNLITNAVKYNDKPEPLIDIRVSRAAGEVQIHVQDNGIGIRPEHQARIFTLFQRLHARDDYGGGTGIGLTIAQKIVHLHGGRLWLDSVPGEGTCFHIALPSGADT